MQGLLQIAENLVRDLRLRSYSKKLLIAGEPLVIHNDFANNYLLKGLEEDGHRLVYSPASEMLWMKLHDTSFEAGSPDAQGEKIKRLRDYLIKVSSVLAEESPFEEDPADLCLTADRVAGLYAGGAGRYRAAKRFTPKTNIDGVLTLSSLYENTGIALDIICKTYEDAGSLPVLNLTFDGNPNENDRRKLESFIHYLGDSRDKLSKEREVLHATS